MAASTRLRKRLLGRGQKGGREAGKGGDRQALWAPPRPNPNSTGLPGPTQAPARPGQLGQWKEPRAPPGCPSPLGAPHTAGLRLPLLRRPAVLQPGRRLSKCPPPWGAERSKLGTGKQLQDRPLGRGEGTRRPPPGTTRCCVPCASGSASSVSLLTQCRDQPASGATGPYRGGLVSTVYISPKVWAHLSPEATHP